MKVGIICANGMEECEGLIVYDLLYRSGIEAKLVGLLDEITSSHELTFKTNININDFDYKDYDCIVLPGGMPGTKNLEANSKVQEIIDYFVSNNKLIAAICAAPSILNNKGLLKDNRFTCFPGFECGLTSTHNKVEHEGNIITARGLGANIEFSYEIIKTLIGEDKAKETLERIQY